MSLARSDSRSRSPSVEVQTELERPATSPSPPLREVNEECYRSKSAIFVKRWCRGSNTCSRCDFEFAPLHGSRLASKHAEHLTKPGSSNLRATNRTSVKSSDDRRTSEVKKEEKLSPVLKKRPPPEASSGDAQITSALLGPGFRTNESPLDSAAWKAYMMMHDPTPALRQLSEYAKPHMGGKQDLLRENPANIHTSKERSSRFLETTEHYILEDYIGNQQLQSKNNVLENNTISTISTRLNDMERRNDVVRDEGKSGPAWPISSASSPVRLPPPTFGGPLDLQWAELQRLYTAAAAGPLPPFGLGLGQPQSMAAELLQRERLEQLANINSALAGIDPNIARRVMDRPNIPGESLFRLQAAAAAAAGGLGNPAFGVDNTLPTRGSATGELSHTHTHSHTHLHLHQPDPSTATSSNAFPPLHPILAAAAAASPFGPPPNPTFSLPPGIDPLLAPPGPPHPTPAFGLPAGPQLAAAAREQELMYRELLSRMQYNPDPVLAQHLLAAQAAAHQEAMQRLDMARLHGHLLPR